MIKGDIKIQQISDTQYKTEFVKEVTAKKGTRDYPSYIVFKKIGNEWKLILESNVVNVEYFSSSPSYKLALIERHFYINGYTNLYNIEDLNIYRQENLDYFYNN